MAKFVIPKYFSLNDIPKFQRFQSMNPNYEYDEQNVAITYGTVINWISILEILWPPFESLNFYEFEIGYMVVNDPDSNEISDSFYKQIAAYIKLFWTIKLNDMYPDGNWEIIAYGFNTNKKIVRAEIRK